MSVIIDWLLSIILWGGTIILGILFIVFIFTPSPPGVYLWWDDFFVFVKAPKEPKEEPKEETEDEKRERIKRELDEQDQRERLQRHLERMKRERRKKD